MSYGGAERKTAKRRGEKRKVGEKRGEAHKKIGKRRRGDDEGRELKKTDASH